MRGIKTKRGTVYECSVCKTRYESAEIAARCESCAKGKPKFKKFDKVKIGPITTVRYMQVWIRGKVRKVTGPLPPPYLYLDTRNKTSAHVFKYVLYLPGSRTLTVVGEAGMQVDHDS